MAWRQATVASSHHAPCSPRPPCSHSSFAVVHLVTRVCSTAASTTRDSGGSSPFPPPSAIGGTRKNKTGLSTVTSSCFLEDPTLHSHPFYHLLREQKRNWSRGWSWCRMTDSIRCRGTGEGARLAVEQVDKEDGEDARILALESELYDFMHKSSKPIHFPTKEELITAGRMDLVEAIAELGGWFSYGWDFGDDEAADTGYGYDDVDDDGGYEEKGGQVHGGERRSDAINSHRREADSGTVAMEHDETADGWQDDNILRQEREMSVVEESGIEGILNRQESSSYLETDNGISSMNKDSDPDAADSEVVLYGTRYGVDGFLTEIHGDDLLNRSVNDVRKGSNEPKSSEGNDLKNIHTCLQVLETELDSVLSSLRSRNDAVSSDKGQENTLKELDELSDALEFQETEIMSAHDKIQSIRAKLAALEGKMALEIIEAQTVVEEMQKRIDAAHKALCVLHTPYVVWPSTASEVFLAGSFDSWTNQMRMEKSSTGVFYLYLKLYPGRYEIKFVVDGVWKIDPLRPVVCNNGHENNLLIIL